MPNRLKDRDTLAALFGESPDAIMVEHFDPPIPAPTTNAAAASNVEITDIAEIVYTNRAFTKLLQRRGLPVPKGSDGGNLKLSLETIFDDGFKNRWYARATERIDNMRLAAHSSVTDDHLAPLMISCTPMVLDGLVHGCWTRITDATAAVAQDVQERRALKQIDAFVRTENVPLVCLAFATPLAAEATAGELGRTYFESTITHITDSAATLFQSTPESLLHHSVATLDNPQVEGLLRNAFPTRVINETLNLGETNNLLVEVPAPRPQVYRVKPTFVFENHQAVEAWLRIEDVTSEEMQARKQKTMDQTRELAMAAASLCQFESLWKDDTLRLEITDLDKLELLPLPTDLDGWAQLLGADRVNVSNQEMEDIMAGRKKEMHFIARLPNIHGEDSHIEVWGLVNPNLDGLHQGHTIGLLRDVTQSERLNARLSEKKTLEGLGVLAGGVAHDFNNLLMSVLGYAELMEADLLDIPARDNADLYQSTAAQNSLQQSALQNITEIRTAALRASELCTSLLAYAGQHLIEKKHLDLTELVRSTTELLEVTVGKRVPLLLNLDNEVLISADKGQLTQVIVNLVGNAADAMEGFKGGVQLTVTTLMLAPEEQSLLADQLEDPAERFACITVRDNGCGMSTETQQRIYEPFFTTKDEGRGLGMAAVHGIVKHHGGAILLRSAEGQGTEFRVCLPLLARVPTSEFPALEAPAPATISRPQVLVVDDEAGVRTIAAEMLRHLNCDVVEAESASVALTILSNHKFDFALVDITMPVMSGPELAELLLEQMPDVKIVLCSGYTEKNVSDALLARCSFIHKPFTLKEISDTLELEAVMGEQAVPV